MKLLLPLTLSLALLGCAGPRGHQRSQAPAPQANHVANAQALASGGYPAAVSESASFSLQSWLVQGEKLPLALTLPSRSQGGQALPLVVYLPGLGESEQAGAQWRQAWAHAGYAVLSVQPLDEDALAWGSELARAAEFKTLAQQRHGASAARLSKLDALLQEARRRAAAGDPDCARLDFGRMAIAGYDLGAQSALLRAGQFRASILLSPLVAPGEEDVERYAGIQTPVLSITSRQDLDPSGFIASAEVRQLPFRQMPAGDKYLLLLDGANHARLAGHSEEELDAMAQDRAAGRGSSSSNAGGGRRGRGGNATRGAEQAPQMLPSARGMPVREAHGKAEFDVLIANTTVAFLDAYLRERPAARKWLQAQLQPWLGELGQWQQR